MRHASLLVIDDDASVRFPIRDYLEAQGATVHEADSCAGAEAALRAAATDAVICDYLLPDGDALALLPRLRAIDPDLPVVILTGHAAIDLAVRAMREGADHFLTKPVEMAALEVLLERLLAQRRERRQQVAAAQQRRGAAPDPFLGSSAAIRALAEQAEQVCGSDSPLLLLGETGTGKGVLARWLHDHSPRAGSAFVDINCAGLSPEFLETELFGHERGAYTGAQTAKPGLLEVAHHGTAFLDEIGDMHLQVQPKLLKVLEEKHFRRLGAVTDRRVDVRLISATHQDLARAVAAQTFRRDLYFRISTVPLVLPPLRQRRDDVPLLAHHLLAGLAADLGRRLELTEEAGAALAAYDWPGNVRELRNVLERAALLSRSDHLSAADLRFQDAPAAASDDTDLSLAEVERRHIERTLARHGGQVARAAQALGIAKSSLYEKLKRYRIGPITGEA